MKSNCNWFEPIFRAKKYNFILSNNSLGFSANSCEKLFSVMNFRSSISYHPKGKKYLRKSKYFKNPLCDVAGAVFSSPRRMFVTTLGMVWPTAGAAAVTSVTRQDNNQNITNQILYSDCKKNDTSVSLKNKCFDLTNFKASRKRKK